MIISCQNYPGQDNSSYYRTTHHQCLKLKWHKNWILDTGITLPYMLLCNKCFLLHHRSDIFFESTSFDVIILIMEIHYYHYIVPFVVGKWSSIKSLRNNQKTLEFICFVFWLTNQLYFKYNWRLKPCSDSTDRKKKNTAHSWLLQGHCIFKAGCYGKAHTSSRKCWI